MRKETEGGRKYRRLMTSKSRDEKRLLEKGGEMGGETSAGKSSSPLLSLSLSQDAGGGRAAERGKKGGGGFSTSHLTSLIFFP